MNIHAKLVERTSLALAILFLSINLCMLLWYIFTGYQFCFHSDSAAKVLLAREITETGSFFPPEWNYVNNDLCLSFKPAFILPLLAFLPAGYAVHAISGLFSSGFILMGIWFLLGITNVDLNRRVWIIAIFAAGISGFMAENLYGQVSYGSGVFFSCCVLFFTFKYFNGDEKKKKYFGVALFAVLLILFWSNPQRAMVYYGVPLVIATVWYVARSKGSITPGTVWFLSAIIFSGILFGTVLHGLTLPRVNNVLGAGNVHWLAYETMSRNLNLTLKGYLAIFGGLPKSGGLVVSKSGIYEAARLGAALVLLLLIPWSVNRALRERNDGTSFLAVFALFVFIPVFFLQVTTTLPDMSGPIGSSRYLVPSLVLLLILALSYPVSWRNNKIIAVSTFAVSLLFVTGGYTTYFMSLIDSSLNYGVKEDCLNSRKLCDFLAQNGLHYGYATYWNAGKLSVLSDEKVLVRQIVIENGLPVPMRHLSSYRWYRPGAWRGASFLLLNKKQAESIDWNLLKKYHGNPIHILSYGNFGIYVYPQNLSAGLPGWDPRIETAEIFYASMHSPKQVGRLEEDDADGGSALIAEKGESGALHFGPYIDVAPGSYKVTFDVTAPYHSGGVVRLDVAASLGEIILAEKVLTSSEGPQELSFTLDKKHQLEFRVFALGNERVVFRNVTIEMQPPETEKRALSRGSSFRAMRTQAPTS